MKYLKSILAIAIIILVTGTMNAQENKLSENSVLWKIEHEDLNKTSYLLGTLHLMCEEDFKLAAKVVSAIKNADALVMEINLSDPEEIKAVQNHMASQKKVSEELTIEQFNKLDELVQSVLQMPLANLDNYGLTTIYSLMISKMLPCSKQKYMEMELQQLAMKNGLDIKGLEKVTEQMALVQKGFTKEYTFNQLMLFESYKKDFNKAIQSYKMEDINTAVSLMVKEAYMDENATKYVQTVRNKNWIEKMPSMMKEGTNVFAVGAAHLTGKDGLISLLREKGYQVTPVFN